MKSLSSLTFALLLAVALVALPGRAGAQTWTWAGGNGSWNVATNWSSGTVPNSGVGTLIDSGTATLPSGINGRSSSLTIGNSGTGAFVVTDGTFGATTVMLGQASGGSGSVVVNGGLFTGTNLYIGNTLGGSGSVTATSGTLESTSTLVVGNSGTGVLNLNGGTVIADTNLILGAASTGMGTVTLSSGSLGVTRNLFVGASGTNTSTLNINGGILTSATASVGDTSAFLSSPGYGAVAMTGGTWNNASILTVGYLGSGSFGITGGSLVSSVINIAAGSNAIGVMNLSGSASVATSTSYGFTTLSIASGDGSTGTLTLNGGTFTTGSMTAASGRNSSAAININAGSTFTARSIGFGSMSSGATGTLNINDGSVFSIGSVTNTGTGVLTVNMNLTGTRTLNTGFTQASGAFAPININKLGSDYLILNSSISTSGTTTISSGTLQMNGTVTTGHLGSSYVVNNGVVIFNSSDVFETFTGAMSGAGSVQFSGSGKTSVSGKNTYAGGTIVHAGTLELSGVGTTISHTGADFVVGDTSGDKALFQDTFASLSTISDRNAIIGNAAGASGIVTMGDFNGAWNNSGSVYVGKSGTGVLSLNSGTMTVASGTTTLAQDAGSAGTLNFTGFGKLNSSVVTGGDGTAIVNFTTNGATIFAQQFMGSLSVNKSGTATAILTGSNTYTGTTAVTSGTLMVNGSINNSTSIVSGSGTLSGTGSVGKVTVGSGGAITSSGTNGRPGKLATLDETWYGGGKFVMSINDFAGSAGGDPGWSSVAITGGLTLGATSGSPFVLKLSTLTAANAAGAAANFSNGTAYQFTIASTTAGITGFDASAFTIDTSGVANTFTGKFTVEQNGNDLQIDYHPMTYDYWTTGFALSGTNAAATTDYDGDGMSNLMEFALGTDPTVPDAKNALPQAGVTTISAQSYATLSYQRPSGGALGVTYIVEENDNLNNSVGWSGANVVQDSVTPGTGGLETVVMRYTTAIGNGGAFLRLRVTQP